MKKAKPENRTVRQWAQTLIRFSGLADFDLREMYNL